jgi:hypothetical protein
MDSRTIKPQHVFALLAIFWCAWLYSEIKETMDTVAWRKKSAAEYQEFRDFHDEGKRFTAENGAALEARIEALEATCEADPAGCR